jgi:hypothetical protein
MPDEPPILNRISAALDYGVDGAALMLTQHGLLGLAVLDVEQNPMLKRAQEVSSLEKRLHGEAIGLDNHATRRQVVREIGEQRFGPSLEMPGPVTILSHRPSGRTPPFD